MAAGVTPLVQRQADGSEEEEKEEEEAVQRQAGAPEEEEKEEEAVQTEGVGSGAPEVTPDLGARINSLRGGGQPLSKSERSFFEPRFGADFSHVRLHTDARAAETARALNARAFTLGSDIAFGPGQYSPGAGGGQHLLAHELTHTVQQSTSVREPIHVLQQGGGGVTLAPTRRIQKAEPVTTSAAAITLGAVVWKCIVGAIVGALFDVAIQAAFHAWRQRSWRFWETSLNYCSIILSAILGCIAAPISVFLLEGWVAARLGTRLGGMAGTLIGKILLFIAKKLAMTIPKGIVGKLAKLGCISPEQASELGVREGPQGTAVVV